MREKNYANKHVLLRLDINAPIDQKTKRIVNQSRLEKSVPTLNYLLDQGARVAIIAHQGDTLDYQNLIPLEEHAEILSELTGHEISYIDDVCGPSACKAFEEVEAGKAVILGNLRYLTEEVSSFEAAVPLTAKEMTETWLVRQLAPIADAYVNDAFSAAHRSAPSMVAFQELLPTAAGDLLFQEHEALSKVLHHAQKPSSFILGGAKISDAFGMIEQVLSSGTADSILTCGVTGVIFVMAQGYSPGKKYEEWLASRKLLDFVPQAKTYLEKYGDRILVPVDLAYPQDGERKEIKVSDLPLDDGNFIDIGQETIALYREEILKAKTIFLNGPPGVYEQEGFEVGSRSIYEAVYESEGYSVLGGGDSVTAAGKFISLDKVSYVCTAGGAMVRFMTGKKLPLITAMENANK